MYKRYLFHSILFSFNCKNGCDKDSGKCHDCEIGKYGDYLRRKQIRNGEATYMTAAERLQYRKDHDMDRTAADKRKDKSRSFDEALVNMNEDQMNIVKEYLNNIEDPEKKRDMI